jgi:hypothetical protein
MYMGQEVKWRLMVTSCHRRLGSYQKALELYEAIHEEFPNNIECKLAFDMRKCSTAKQLPAGIKYLITLRKDMGQPVDEFLNKLAALDRKTYGEMLGQPENTKQGAANVSGTRTAAQLSRTAVPIPVAAPLSRPLERPTEAERVSEESLVPAPMAAPMVRPPQQRATTVDGAARKEEDDDNFDGTDVNDLLA